MSAVKLFGEEVSLAIGCEGKLPRPVMKVAGYVCLLAQIRGTPKDDLTSENPDFVKLCKKVDDALAEGTPVFDDMDIRRLINHLCSSHDGDERVMGEALRFFSDGASPKDLVTVLNGAIMSFGFILKDFKKKINQGR